MVPVLIVGAISGAIAAVLKGRVGVLVVIACVLILGGAVAAVHGQHAVELGLLAAAVAQVTYLAAGYALEYVRECAARRAMRVSISRELKSLYVPQQLLPARMIKLVVALDHR